MTITTILLCVISFTLGTFVGAILYVNRLNSILNVNELFGISKLQSALETVRFLILPEGQDEEEEIS